MDPVDPDPDSDPQHWFSVYDPDQSYKITDRFFFDFFSYMYCILTLLHLLPSDSTVPENAGIEPRTEQQNGLTKYGKQKKLSRNFF